MLKHRKHLLFIILALIIAYPLFMVALPGCGSSGGGGGGGGFTVVVPTVTPDNPIPSEPTPTPIPTTTTEPTPTPETPDASTKYAYVSAIDEHCVYVFNADNFTFVKKGTGLNACDRMCFSKKTKRTDGGPKYLYVANFTNVKRFDLETKAEDLGWNVSSDAISIYTVQITPDDKYLYATDTGGRKIRVFNVDNETEITGVSLPIVMPANTKLLNASMTPDGKKLVIGDSGSHPPTGYHIPFIGTDVNNEATYHKIYATIDKIVDGTAQAFTHPFLNSYAYVTMPEANKVVIVNINTSSIVGDPITVGAFPESITISPDGNYAYVTNYDDATISVLQLSGATATVIGSPIPIPEINSPHSGISSDGKYLWVLGYEKIYVVDTTTKTIVKTLEGLKPGDGWVGFAHVLVE